jgi:hypothetical protein
VEEHIEKTKVSSVSKCCHVPCSYCSCYPSYLFHHNCLSHTRYLEHFRPATRISIWDYNLALLSVTDLCAKYTYYSLVCLPSSTYSSDQYKERPLQFWCHFLTGITSNRQLPSTACVGKNLVRRV